MKVNKALENQRHQRHQGKQTEMPPLISKRFNSTSTVDRVVKKNQAQVTHTLLLSKLHQQGGLVTHLITSCQVIQNLK